MCSEKVLPYILLWQSAWGWNSWAVAGHLDLHS